ncbi:MAG: dihydroorotate dehydrogenase [bacterium]|nr:dihydroorotate dehydrogenase [bacterium]
MADLSVTVNDIRFKNPVLIASGIAGYGLEWADFFDPASVGGLVLKGTSREPWPGNPPHRLAETPSGMLNSIGLENVGLDAFIAEKMPALEGLDTVIIANVVGCDIAEYVEVADALAEQTRIDALELNVSCPNVEEGGIAFGTDAGVLAELAGEVIKAVAGRKPVWVKLSPNVTDITAMARATEKAGADAVSLINTLLGMAVDVERRKPVLGNIYGGLSGPAIKPVALRMVHQVAKAVGIPIVGIGGITTWRDAVEFIMCGATLVQVGTALFADPAAPTKIIEGLNEYCEREGISDLGDIRGIIK